MVYLPWLLLLLPISVVHTWNVTSIAGCTYDFTSSTFGLTLGCQRSGGQTLYIYGLFEQQDIAKVSIGFYQAQAPTNVIKCRDIARLSDTLLTCVTPPGNGMFWIPRIINADTALAAALPPSQDIPYVSFSYLQGGFELFQEGVSTYVNLVTSGTSAASFRAGGFMAGMTVQPTAGSLDANVWRVTGLNGSPASPECYTFSPPVQRYWPIGRCATFWGTGQDIPKINSSGTYAVYSDRRQVISHNFDSTKPTFASPSSFPGWDSYGGLTSTNVGGVLGGLMFIPFARSTGQNDLVPGAVDLRLVNQMGQTITGLSVRYSLNCRNSFDASTTVKLQYTHEQSGDWFFLTAANSAYTTPTSATVPLTCVANDYTCWTDSTFMDVELTDLHWNAGEDFYVRWFITSTAIDDTHGDPCRIVDIELTPYVYKEGDQSLHIEEVDTAYVDISAGTMAANSNYTIEMSVHPSTYSLPAPGLPRPTTSSSDMVLISSWNSETQVEWSWVILPSGYIAVKQSLPLSNASVLWVSHNALVPRDDWTSIALQQKSTASGLFLRVFIDGSLADEKLMTFNVPALGGRTLTSRIRIGQRAMTPSRDPFIGLIDEVRLWPILRSDNDIYLNRGVELSRDYLADLFRTQMITPVVYLKMNSFDQSTLTIPNSRLGLNPLNTWIISANWTESQLSTISSSRVLSLTGGTVTCAQKYVVPGGQVKCSFRVLTQDGLQQPVFSSSQFTVQVVSGAGKGTVGPWTPDATGVTWNFTFTADIHPGIVTLQAYDQTGDPFAGAPVMIIIVSEGCQACEFRESYGGSKLYSCLIDGHRFLRQDITNVPGICPMS